MNFYRADTLLIGYSTRPSFNYNNYYLAGQFVHSIQILMVTKLMQQGQLTPLHRITVFFSGARKIVPRHKEYVHVLLRSGISLTDICEKVKFSTCVFVIIFVNMNGHTCKLFQIILDDVRAKGNGEINTS